MTTKINQKDYLKKYLSSDKDDQNKKKKKKHKKPVGQQTVRIIDDDIDISKLQSINDDDLDLLATGEDAPQIVGVIDDRPPDLMAKDYRNNSKWKVVSNDNGFESSLSIQEIGENQSEPVGFKKKLVEVDMSPPRKSSKKKKDKKNHSRDSLSKTSLETSPKRRRQISPDASPPRKRNTSPDASPPRRRRMSLDESPPRRRKMNSDESPPRRRKISSYESPPRKRKENESLHVKKLTPDVSPPRRRKRDIRGDESPPRRQSRKTRSISPAQNILIKVEPYTNNSSPKRRKPSRFDSPIPIKKEMISPGRIKEEKITPPNSPVATSSKSSRRGTSPKKRRSRSRDNQRRIRTPEISPNRSPSPSSSNKKMTRTLDGKAAGLQNATDLRIENEKFRDRERQFFETLSEETLGRNSAAVKRDRQTGRIRDLEGEVEVQRKKDKKAQEKKAIYDRWGAGVKQVEDHRKKLDEMAHEMNKPLARYADDSDLDDYLKQQERDGDPMLEYMRQKQKDKRSETGMPLKPKYEGAYPDNRFSIRPGHKWDGVDRSNGFEKKWFDQISKKKAGEEEAYRYSTEDM